ncbi:HI1506-related protein [Pontibacterium granulatum]|uniref:HI1506-related protein n=1 Tax=Pontibacterium granulatum TaxID=2036029 RepID=UPI00249AC026|nr:HI1506-related protein [Pontibacterium granulatum]MDI3326775.1 HI1506-related protein [Pontibacterium granulatum]
MFVRITSAIEGFRRAGVAHPAQPTVYPADHFSEEQHRQLQAEARLSLEYLEEDPNPNSAAPDSDPETTGTVGTAGISEPVTYPGKNQLQPLIDLINALDPNDPSLWNKDGTPKAANFPLGTSAEDRAAAWAMVQAQAEDA